ncbi:kinase-like domain-containing protein [Roridomyces roridus]|uniref:non-specific serine/threonine protein kinase n=1 Tax=Roridomyces roridus TaxID=1738132 RepID=A0AAD7CE13_9AGAR|nr:kinase-like domain-containing protein [Roridomyces roridus]
MHTDDLDAQITSPLGAWPGDLDQRQVFRMKGRRLSASEHAAVSMIKNERLVLKSFYDLNGKDVAPQVTTELRMMLLAGEDVSVKVEGRYIIRSKLQGFIMPCETLLDLELPKAIKRDWIEQLQSLVRRVHNKGIIHSDIKPDNILLRKSDGRLIFCDWGSAQLKSEGKPLHQGTYLSPWRCRQYYNDLDPPLCEADDLYALGVTIWHIWVGRPPFDADIANLDWEIAHGLKPDLDAVDDEKVRSLIGIYLDAAPAGA